MKTSDEELDKLITWNYPANLYPLVNSALIDRRDLRKLARDFLLTISDECSCDTTCGTHDETCDSITALKTHLEAKP